MKRTPVTHTHPTPTPAWSQSLPYWASDERERRPRTSAQRSGALRRLRTALRARVTTHG
jgi:hypothetical protein